MSELLRPRGGALRVTQRRIGDLLEERGVFVEPRLRFWIQGGQCDELDLLLGADRTAQLFFNRSCCVLHKVIGPLGHPADADPVDRDVEREEQDFSWDRDARWVGRHAKVNAWTPLRRNDRGVQQGERQQQSLE